jgi:hypothetical protein
MSEAKNLATRSLARPDGFGNRERVYRQGHLSLVIGHLQEGAAHDK